MPKKSCLRKKLTRQEQLDLDVEISFLEGIVKRDPHYLEALQVLGDDYTRRGKFVEGLRVDQQLSRLQPEDATAHYNLACSYSLNAQCEESAGALERAVQLGYRDFKWMAQDPDLSNLRRTSLYRKIRALLKSIKI